MTDDRSRASRGARPPALTIIDRRAGSRGIRDTVVTHGSTSLKAKLRPFYEHNQPVRRTAMTDILHRAGIKSSSDEVYKALTTREGLAAWWTSNTQGESKVGGTVKFRFSSGGTEIGGFDMKVLELQPARRVLWQVVDGPEEWIGTRVSFDLKQSGDHSIVLFKHQDWKEPVEFMHHCSTKWAVYLMSLKSLVEARKGTPNPNDPHISGDGPD